MKFSALCLAVLACVGVARCNWNCADGRPYLTLQPKFNFCNLDVGIKFAGTPVDCSTAVAAATNAEPFVTYEGRITTNFYTLLLVQKGVNLNAYTRIWLEADIPGDDLAGTAAPNGVNPCTGTPTAYPTASLAAGTYQLFIFEQVDTGMGDFIYFTCDGSDFNPSIFIDNNCNGKKVFNELLAIREFVV